MNWVVRKTKTQKMEDLKIQLEKSRVIGSNFVIGCVANLNIANDIHDLTAGFS